MFSCLIVIIYLAFISLGLPDALLGSAWPVMRFELNAPLSMAGVISMIIAGGTIVSSLLSDRLTYRLGAGKVTVLSVLMTAVALFGFSVSSAVWMLILWAVPYGLGAGAVDAALNNYVAIHYSSRSMSWLHCFWGLGASTSPFIMSYCLEAGMGWPTGYRTVSLIQFGITAMLFFSLPLWKKSSRGASDEPAPPPKRITDMLRVRGVPLVMLTFFGYCAMENTAGLWASTYLVSVQGMAVETAARFASLYYLGITIGRFLNGFVANRFGDRTMIRVGLALCLVSIGLIVVPGGAVAPFALVALGIGSGPIYPCIIHATPANFGEENSQAIIGIQMASAYTGSTLIPPVFGLVAQYVSVGLYPWFLLFFAGLMAWMSERLNQTIRQREQRPCAR